MTVGCKFAMLTGACWCGSSSTLFCRFVKAMAAAVAAALAETALVEMAGGFGGIIAIEDNAAGSRMTLVPLT